MYIMYACMHVIIILCMHVCVHVCSWDRIPLPPRYALSGLPRHEMTSAVNVALNKHSKNVCIHVCIQYVCITPIISITLS